MENYLMKIFNDPFISNRANSLINSLFGDIDAVQKAIIGEAAPFAESSFKEVDGKYQMAVAVDADAKASNVSVEVEDGVIAVEYNFENKNTKCSKTIKETLPSNLDEETLEASVEDGKLVITAEIVEDEPEEEDEPEDTKTVRINRK